MVPKIAQAISIVLFAWYGVSCFLSRRMVSEFEHWRVAELRVLTGSLQILGSIGLIVGYVNRFILLFSATGLSVMMILAVITRIRIRDPLYASIPALTLCVLNLYLVLAELLDSHQ
jgi:hypothetical protein